ncbi:MAG TPA: hypothetical protein GX510_00725 [Firmicutes bacterium]|nr:hypothetical protein [Candidatus Fermentithermobacillaceae bacterium]
MPGNSTAKRSSRVVSAFLLGISALVLSFALNFFSDKVSFSLSPYFGVPFLLIVIALGIAADVVGIASARAREPALMSMASRKIKGARESLWFIRNADKVSSLANDLLGDVCATVAGGLAVGLSFRFAGSTRLTRPVLSALAVGLAAALAVGGKALMKGIALKRAESIMYRVGLISSVLRGVFPWLGSLRRDTGTGRLDTGRRRRRRNDPS